ncbi:MAG TPA: hypothetical protein VGQ64_02065 [Candidatus Limnocylindrales bacterium]|nr:hypothetical protein [Candidatus Limnocylindrales bacterium]
MPDDPGPEGGSFLQGAVPPPDEVVDVSFGRIPAQQAGSRRRADVAGIADPVTVAVGLVVRCEHAVVDAVGDVVAVEVAEWPAAKAVVDYEGRRIGGEALRQREHVCPQRKTQRVRSGPGTDSTDKGAGFET